MSDLSWFKNAPCVGQSHLFFTPPYSENSRVRARRERAAVAICMDCPVRLQCRDHARQHSELGIWGGETEDERWRSGFLNVNSAIRRKRPESYYERRALLKSEGIDPDKIAI